MLTIPAGTHNETGVPYGPALMVSVWEEDKLVKWGSAIEDLIVNKSEEEFDRTKLKWYVYTKRNIPVLNL
jgi:amidase